MLFIYTLPLNSSEGLEVIILYIKQNFDMSATRLRKYFIYICIFKETVAVLYGNTYYETPCMMKDNAAKYCMNWQLETSLALTFVF